MRDCFGSCHQATIVLWACAKSKAIGTAAEIDIEIDGKVTELINR